MGVIYMSPGVENHPAIECGGKDTKSPLTRLKDAATNLNCQVDFNI